MWERPASAISASTIDDQSRLKAALPDRVYVKPTPVRRGRTPYFILVMVLIIDRIPKLVIRHSKRPPLNSA